MNWHHEEGCGAQKAVRIEDTEIHEYDFGRAVKVDWMTCDACGDVWPVSQEVDA